MTSNFYDFCQKDNLDTRFIWKVQSLLFNDVYYYWDRNQKSFARAILNVKGKIKRHRTEFINGLVCDSLFVPNHKLVKYNQIVNAQWYKS